jgi:general stress protein CsbA
MIKVSYGKAHENYLLYGLFPVRMPALIIQLLVYETGRSFVTLMVLALLIGISITNGYGNSMNVVNDKQH